MVAIWEYRIVLPFTVQEYKIAQLYMVAKYSASESNADNGDGVEVLKNEPYEEGNRRGQYTHKVYHLASKLPSWLVSLIPKKALTLEEEAWNAYPDCTTILKCQFLSKFKLVLKTTHYEDRGNAENALNLDPKTLKKRQVEYIDIATDPVETYIDCEDPAKFRSRRTGRGPLGPGWSKMCSPVMCAYKCVTVDVPYWGFGSRIEKYISKHAQRKILLAGHRKCFCWLDEWHGLTMDDIRRMELETEEAMAKVRQIALRRVAAVGDEDATVPGIEGLVTDELSATGVIQENQPLPTGPLSTRTSLNKPKAGSLSRTTTPAKSNRSLSRRSSFVGPSIAVGISTMSASEIYDDPIQDDATSLEPQAPVEKEIEKELQEDEHPAESNQLYMRSGSCQSFNSSHSGDDDDNDSIPSPVGEKADVAQYCVDVLDRAIHWSKERAKSAGPSGSKSSGKRPPANEDTIARSREDVDHCVGVLATALWMVKKAPMQPLET